MRVFDVSKTDLIGELRRQKELRAENQKLKRELEIAYGQVLGLEDLQKANQDSRKAKSALDESIGPG